MQPTNQKRYYTPQFSELAAVSVRRLSWAMGVSMPAAVNIMVQLVSSFVDSSKVCQSCKDNTKCQGCSFHIQQQKKDIFSLLSKKEQEAIQAVF